MSRGHSQQNRHNRQRPSTDRPMSDQTNEGKVTNSTDIGLQLIGCSLITLDDVSGRTDNNL
ncbi:hypothetical protein FRX31_028218 [Thalictrum thalictroides]|uniref:Uncharacterized protein n=1 Tax=Thalictrum thalictroides TaxID=46969 RepID=A0A7J6VAS7_THATH|nr:hypothetical protein FRX31_028218 [Thalictrum thalictroides]